MKKIILVLSVLVFFFGFKLASASVVINEIMYDPVPSDNYNEWVEIYNNGTESVDLSNLLVCTKSVIAGYIKHSDSSLNKDNGLILEAGKFAVISDGGSGTEVYDNFSVDSSSLALHVSTAEICSGLTNDPIDPGKTIELGGLSSDSVSYLKSLEASNDGNSLQLINGEWKAGSPTPGAENEDSSGGDENDDDEEDTTNDDEEDSSDKTTAEIQTATPTLKTKILTKTLAFVGQPTEFSLDVKYGSSTYTSGKYFWNFGDGDSKEVINQPDKIYHTYFYPGEYAVSSEYYQSYVSGIPDVTNKTTIKVVPLTVSISKVGDAKDFFIELTNNSNYEIDISRWVINANGKIFTFPRNTAIMQKKQMTVSGKITGFVSGDEKNLKLISSAGDTVFDYNPPITQTEIVAENPVPAPVKISTAEPVNNVSSVSNAMQNDGAGNSNNLMENTITPMPENQIPIPNENLFENLPASPVLSEQNTKNSNSYFLWIGLFFFLSIGASAVYFIRRGRNNTQTGSNVGDDFSILDE